MIALDYCGVMFVEQFAHLKEWGGHRYAESFHLVAARNDTPVIVGKDYDWTIL